MDRLFIYKSAYIRNEHRSTDKIVICGNKFVTPCIKHAHLIIKSPFELQSPEIIIEIIVGPIIVLHRVAPHGMLKLDIMEFIADTLQVTSSAHSPCLRRAYIGFNVIFHSILNHHRHSHTRTFR